MLLSAGPVDLRALPACLLLLVLAGCAGTLDSGAAIQSQPAGQKMLVQGQGLRKLDPAPVGLPSPMDMLHSASAEAQFEQLGSDAKQISSGAALSGDQLVLDASSRSQGSEWGIFTLAGPDAEQFLSLQVDAAVSSEMWLALADTVSNRWSWFGPYSAGTELDLTALSFVSTDPLGAVLLAPAGHSVTVNTVVLSTVQPDNNPPLPALDPPSQSGDAPYEAILDATLSSDPDAGDSIALFEWDFESDGTFDLSGATESSASPTYTDPGDYVVTLRLTDTHGATATVQASVNVTAAGNNPPTAAFDITPPGGQAPVTINLDASASDDGGDAGDSITTYEWDFGGDGSYEETGPNPTTSHEYRAAGRFQIVLRVSDSAGNQNTLSQSVDIRPQEVLLDADGWGDIELLNVGGNPALAYSSTADNSVKFLRSSDAQGQSWGSPVTVIVPAEQRAAGLSAAMINGRPAIVYSDAQPSGSPQSNKMQYIRALDAEGTSWGSPVEVAVFASSGQYSLNTVQGRPAMAFAATGSADSVDLWYVRANNQNGTSWGSAVLVDAQDYAGYDTDLRSVNGQPAICYHRGPIGVAGAEVLFCRALDATGTSWGVPQLLDSSPQSNLTYTSMALQAGRPVITYVKRNFNGDQAALHFLRALDDDGSSWSAIQTVDTGEGENDFVFTDITTVGDLSFIITKYDNSGAELRLYSAQSADGTAWNDPLVLSSGDGVGTFCKVRTFGGLFHMAYAVTDLSELRYSNNAPVP